MTALDSNMPKGFENDVWLEVTDMWWKVVGWLSWTMIGTSNVGSKFFIANIILATSVLTNMMDDTILNGNKISITSSIYSILLFH